VKKKISEYVTELIAHPADWADHEAAEMAYVNAEETRLLYVAATRARELLVVSRLEKSGKGQRPWAALEGHVLSAVPLESPEVEPPKAKDQVDVSAKARAKATVARLKRREAASKATLASASVTGGKPDGGKAEGGAGGAEPARLDAGPAWGSLVHGLLEHAMKHPSATPADLERLARWLTVESNELRPVIPNALDLVEAVARAPFWEEARAGGEVHAEVPFAVRVQAGESLGSFSAAEVPAVLHGVIDLVFRGAGGWRILDYKTDLAAAAGESLAARHAPQLAQYRAAWERITGEKVAGRGIVALRAGAVEWQ